MQVITDYKVEAKIAEQQGITLSEKDRDAIRVDAVEYMGTVDGRILKQHHLLLHNHRLHQSQLLGTKAYTWYNIFALLPSDLL